VFNRTFHFPLSTATSIQFIPLHLISLRSILIKSPYLRLCLPSGFLPPGFPTKSYIHSSSPRCVLHAAPISSILTS
jgi:hypothetical protein